MVKSKAVALWQVPVGSVVRMERVSSYKFRVTNEWVGGKLRVVTGVENPAFREEWLGSYKVVIVQDNGQER